MTVPTVSPLSSLAAVVRGRAFAWLLYFAVAAALPFLLQAVLGESFSWGARTLCYVGIYAIAALGLNIVVGYCGLLNLGFGGFMLIGAYTTGILMKEYGFSFWAAALVSVGHGALWGIILGIPTLRLTGDYFAIVTFGFSQLVTMTAMNWDRITRGTKGYPGIPRPEVDLTWIPGVSFRHQFQITSIYEYWYLVAALLALCLFVADRLLRSRLGRAWQALREDEVAAEACGINAMWYKTLAFAISAGYGALAGSIIATYDTMISTKVFDFMTSVYVLCYVVLGGMGTVLGPLAGTALLVTLVEWLRENPAAQLARVMSWWPAAADWLARVPYQPDMRFVLYGILLILMIRFRPEGLLPNRARARELHEHGEAGDPDHESLFELRQR